MSNLELDISQLDPHLIGHRLEVEDENGYRVGIRLARYEVLTEADDATLYLLYSDPAPVAVRVRPDTKLLVAITWTGEPPVPGANGLSPAAAGFASTP